MTLRFPLDTFVVARELGGQGPGLLRGQEALAHGTAALCRDADLRGQGAPPLFAYVLLAAASIVTHQYYGIVHDGRLYLVQALRAADPSFLSDDLYFAFGSQDSFTRFSDIYAILLSQVSAAVAHWVATLAGQAAWFAAMLFLVRTLFGRPRDFIVAAAAVIAMNPLYGGYHVFGYGEPFATPRLYVEALAMVGLALGLRGRPISACLCMCTAMVLHPLMALPGIVVLALMVGWHDRRMWFAAVVALGAALGFALAGVEPFTRALHAFDSAWFEVALRGATTESAQSSRTQSLMGPPAGTSS